MGDSICGSLLMVVLNKVNSDGLGLYNLCHINQHHKFE